MTDVVAIIPYGTKEPFILNSECHADILAEQKKQEISSHASVLVS